MIPVGARIFLTGATGALGRYALRELVERGYDVTALVRKPVTLDGARTVEGDLEEVEKFADEVAKADAVVHLASTRSEQRGKVVFIDVVGTGKLLDAWRRGPFVYVSSQTVYGKPRGPLTEDHPYGIEEWYDLGKFCGEFQVRKASGQRARGPGISLRPPIVFSPVENQFLDLLYKECATGRKFFFPSDEAVETHGSTYIGARDFARATARVLTLNEAGAYNVGAGFCRWKDLIKGFNRHGGTGGRITVRNGGKAAPDEARLPGNTTALDSSRLRTLIDFETAESWEDLVLDYLRERSGGPR
jgi:nucleoside-diphosphate-sugar epimerase